jgi:hypothetical protein
LQVFGLILLIFMGTVELSLLAAAAAVVVVVVGGGGVVVVVGGGGFPPSFFPFPFACGIFSLFCFELQCVVSLFVLVVGSLAP